MIITCPRCFTTYDVPDAAISAGKMVRCSGCRFEWQESPVPTEALAGLAPEPEIQPAPAPAAAPEPAPSAPPPPPVADPVPAAPAKPLFTVTAAPAAPAGPGVAKRLGTGAAWLVFALATLGCILVLFREPLGHRSLALTDMYESIGLPIEGPNQWFRFENVQLEKSEADNRTVFNVHGVIVNQSRRERPLPPLKLFWRSQAGTVGPMVVITAENQSLIVGAKTAFFGELRNVDASTGGEVKITFLTDREAATLKPGEVADPMFRPAHPPAPAAMPAASHEAPHSAPEDSHGSAPAPAQHH